jgi:hypothetical protein
MKDFDIDHLPPGLVAPPAPVDYVAAANRAEALVQEIRSAKERGLLNRARVGRALAEINADLMTVGQQWNAVQGNERLFRIQQFERRKNVVGPFGTRREVESFSALDHSYKTICDCFAEIELLCEGITQ